MLPYIMYDLGDDVESVEITGRGPVFVFGPNSMPETLGKMSDLVNNNVKINGRYWKVLGFERAGMSESPKTAQGLLVREIT